jgi:hypothetical protein
MATLRNLVVSTTLEPNKAEVFTKIFEISTTFLDFVTKSPESAPNDFDLAIGFIRSYLVGALMIFGLVGNILSAVVFYRRRNREDGWTWYLFWLAISDTGCLLSTGLPEWTSYGLFFASNGEVYFPLLTLSDFSCRALR